MDGDTGPQTREIMIPRTARYAQLGAPPGAADELWLVCHGYAQLASRFIRRFGAIDNGKRLVVAPEALSRFYLSGSSGPHSGDDKVGASWMTRESRDSEIADQVTYLDLVQGRLLEGVARSRVRVVALGFSQGAAVVCRWAAKSKAPPDDLILWGSGVPAELLEGEGKDALTRATLTIVVGDSDPVAGGGMIAAHRAQLDAAGLAYEFVGYLGGHELDGNVLSRIAEAIANRVRSSRAGGTP